MSIVACTEVARGTGVSGKFGESFVYTRKWHVRVDSPSTSRTLIARAPAITFGAAHPETASHVAMEFDCTEVSGDGMLWEVVVKYVVPPFDNRPHPSTGLPADCWSGSGSGTTIPAWRDKDGNHILNSAGDPLEGGEQEATDFVLSLTKCYDAVGDWSPLARSRSNTVNNATWNSSPARTWKVAFKSAQKKEMTIPGVNQTRVYWEVSWEFHYRDSTWDWKPWDVGFNQLVDSAGNPDGGGTRKAAILGADRRPVRQPVGLGGGIALPVGAGLNVLAFRIYAETDFSVFGTPS